MLRKNIFWIWLLLPVGLLGGCETLSRSVESAQELVGLKEEEKLLEGTRKAFRTAGEPISSASASGKSLTPGKIGDVAAITHSGGNQSNYAGNAAFGASPRIIWRKSLGSSTPRIFATPLMAEGRAYFYSPTGTVTALNTNNGGTVWETSIRPENEDGYALGGGIAYDNGAIFVASGFRTLTKLSASSGKTIWSITLNAPARSAPTAAQGMIFVVTAENSVLALSQDKGEERWTHFGLPEQTSLLGSVGPAVRHDRLVVPYSSGEVIAFNPKSGVPEWDDQVVRAGRTLAISGLNDVSANPVIVGNQVFIAGVAGRIVAVGSKHGDRIWTKNAGTVHDLAVSGQGLYIVDLRNRVVGMHTKSGEIHFITQLPTKTQNGDDPIDWAGPTLAGNALWVVSSQGTLTSINASTGRIIDNLKIGKSAYLKPVAHGGTMLIVTADNNVIALR